jgi:hypothetical protein
MPPISPLSPPIQDKILYFAYGANISSKTLIKRSLGAVANTGTVARVTQPNIALVFGHRGGYATLTEVEGIGKGLESNIDSGGRLDFKQRWWQWQQLPQPSSTTSSSNNNTNLVYWQPYGMLYELTTEQLQLIEAKEIGYQRKIIPIHISSTSASNNTTDDSSSTTSLTTLDATVFVSASYMTLRNPVAPTRRYRDLILEGALGNNMPESFINWLEQLPVVDDVAVLGSAEYSDTLAEAALKSIGAVMIVALGINMFILH